MGHTKAKDLVDLESELKKIRALENVKEVKPGIFYFKRIPFLHFHDKDGKRWVHVKRDGKWAELEIDFGVSFTGKKQFINKVQAAHDNILYGGKAK